MHGVSPVNHFLSSKQLETSTEISQALPDFPTTISDLISEFAAPDFSMATLPLEFDKNREVIQNQRNQNIINMIELALSSPSTECAASIKSDIFRTATEFSAYHRTIKPYLTQIITRLQRSGKQINLDEVFLESLRMTQYESIDFSGMSAKRATFYQICMFRIKLDHADFTGARFIESTLAEASLRNTIFADATFESVTISGTVACGLIGNQSAILKCSRTHPTKLMTKVNEIIVGNIYLNLVDFTASADTEKYTLIPEDLNRPLIMLP